MLVDQLLELADHVSVAAERDVGLDAPLECEYAELLQPSGDGIQQRLAAEIRKGRPSPERERSAEDRGRLGGVSTLESTASLGREVLEQLEIEDAARDVEHVTGTARLDRVLAERLAEPRYVPLHLVRRRPGRIVAPQPVDQASGRDDGVGLTEQQSERRALLRRPEPRRPSVDEGLERTEQPELDLHRPTLLR